MQGEYILLQSQIYENKVKKGFNITDLDKQIVLMTEEFGELCDAIITNNHDEITDATGDLMIYCLGVSAMLQCDPDAIITRPESKMTFSDCTIHIGRELGLFAKIYRRSNKQPAKSNNSKDALAEKIGLLMGYCSALFAIRGINEQRTLQSIIDNNVARTNQVRISP